jgi:PQQ-dependent catabolism-associated CXXCW motif protein
MPIRRARRFHAALRSGPSLGVVLAAALLCAQPVSWPAEGVREPDAFRVENYRAPTPATLKGARVVDTIDAERLWRDKAAVFVDVMPQAPRPANLPAGTIWRDKPRLSIPGSAWLPDTGYGELAPATETYLKDPLATLTGGDRGKAVVMFCLQDCWMSWNAAKRAVGWGYTNIIWYPEGTDGWGAVDLPLEPVHPMPR